MFHTTPGLSQTVKQDIEEILQNGNYYYSTEIGRELNALSNAVDCLNLDESILSSSQRWQKKFDPIQTSRNKSAVFDVLRKLSTYLFDYKSQMVAENIEGKQENQLRELHQWAVSNLQMIKNELQPYSDGARSRLNQFSDDIGVTDRYTGYRQNLTRGSLNARPSTACPVMQHSRTGTIQQSGYYPPSQDCVTDTSALGKRVTFGSSQPQKLQYKGYRTIDTLYPRSNTVFLEKPFSYSQALKDTKELNNLNRTMSTTTFGLEKSKSFGASQLPSVQEQAGINTKFPGDSEYMTRFTNPPDNVCSSGFTINPSPDFTLTGRQLTKTTWDPSSTEYQTRFEWPDANKIERLPWLRK